MAPKINANKVEKMFEELKVEIITISNDINTYQRKLNQSTKRTKYDASVENKIIKSSNSRTKYKNGNRPSKVKRKQFRNVRFTEFH